MKIQFLLRQLIMLLLASPAVIAKFQFKRRNSGGFTTTKSRQLGDGDSGNNDGSDNSGGDIDFTNYSLQYTGCSAIKVYGGGNNNNDGGGDGETVLSTQRMVTYRLCPTTNNGNGNGNGGCNNGFGNGCGEYVTTLELFLQGIYSYEIARMATLCEQCQECASLEKQHYEYEYYQELKEEAINEAQQNYQQFQNQYYSTNGYNTAAAADGSDNTDSSGSSNNDGDSSGSSNTNDYYYEEQGQESAAVYDNDGDNDDETAMQIAYYDTLIEQNNNNYASSGQYDSNGDGDVNGNGDGSENNGDSSYSSSYSSSSNSEGAPWDGYKIVNGHYGYVDDGSGSGSQLTFIQEWGYIYPNGRFVSLEDEDADEIEDVETCDEEDVETCMEQYGACLQVLGDDADDDFQEFLAPADVDEQATVITIQDYLECTLIDGTNLYLGPYCNEDDEITLGIYEDADCTEKSATMTTTLADVLGMTTTNNNNGNENQGNGNNSNSNFNIIPTTNECISCDSVPAEEEEEQDGEEVEMMCSYLYDVSGKCNKNMNSNMFSHAQDNIDCPYIESLKSNTYDEYGEITWIANGGSGNGGSSGSSNAGGSGSGGGGGTMDNWKEFAMTNLKGASATIEVMSPLLKAGLVVTAFAAAAMAIYAIALNALLTRRVRRRKPLHFHDDDVQDNHQVPPPSLCYSTSEDKLSSKGDKGEDSGDGPNDTTMEMSFEEEEEEEEDNNNSHIDGTSTTTAKTRTMLV